MKEKNEYILGTEQEELFRLGIQHGIWSGEAKRGWEIAGFTAGQTILDLGCGPGYCSTELAYLVGQSGQIVAVDQSRQYIDFLKKSIAQHHLNIDARCVSFDNLKLASESLDGMFCRWAMAWIPNVKEVLNKVKNALKPGGVMVIHEYFDWSIFQTEPELPALEHGITAIYNQFKDQKGDIDIGRKLPKIFGDLDLEVVSIRPMSKMPAPQDAAWQWPYTFLNIYMPKLMDSGLLSEQEVEAALNDLEQLNENPDAMILCPQMVEVVAVKI